MGIVLEDGSGVAIDWVTGPSYSSARRRLSVQSGQRKGRKELRLPIRALTSVIVVTEKVMRKQMGPLKSDSTASGGKVIAPRCASKPSRSWRGARRSQVQELRTSTLIRDHPIRGEDQRDFWGESEGSTPPLPQDSLPDGSEARNDFWFQETSYTAIKLNPESNFTRREKNLSRFHWNTLTFPELRRQTWMLCDKAASMIIGISMGQEIYLILGQVALSLLY